MNTQSKATKYLVVFGCFCLCATLGVASTPQALYFVPMFNFLDVPRTALTAYDTFAKIIGVILSLSYANIYRKIGPKFIALIGGLSYIVMLLCWINAKSLTLVFIGGLFYGAAYVFTGAMVATAVIPYWFEKNAGTASAFGVMGMSVVGAISTLVVTRLLQGHTYQQVMGYVVPIVAVLTLLAFLLIKTSPTDPLNKKNQISDTGQKKSLGYGKMIKNPLMWICFIEFIGIGGIQHAASNGITLLANTTLGVDNPTGGFALTLCWGTIPFTKFIYGRLHDKFGIWAVLLPTHILLILSYVLLAVSPMFHGEAIFYVIAVIHAFDCVIATIFPAFFLASVWGPFYTAAVLGLCQVFYQIGRGVLTPLVNIGYDLTGSYSATFLVYAFFSLIMLILATTAVKRGKKQQAAGVKMLDVEVAAESQAY